MKIKDNIPLSIEKNDSIDSEYSYLNQSDPTKATEINFVVFFGVFFIVSVLSFFFKKHSAEPSLNIAMLYTMGVFFVARYTEGYMVGIMFTVAAVLCTNFFFIYPYEAFNFSYDGYLVTFAGMLAIGILTSIMSTRFKNQERRLRDQEKRLAEAEKEKMKANLLRAVSHDIRTPLTGIIGSSSSILEDYDSMKNEDIQKLVKNIEDDADWLLNMVENLLTVTRIGVDAPSVALYEEPIDEVIGAAVSQFKKRFPEYSVNVVIPKDIIFVLMDEMLVQQVIINILQNAVMHSKTKEPILLSVDSKDGMAYVHIRDYGEGIDPEKIEHLFEGAGFSSQDKRPDSYKGMGIGLSICKTIITAHGGEIKAINHSDGAEFEFSLKMAESEMVDLDIEEEV